MSLPTHRERGKKITVHIGTVFSYRWRILWGLTVIEANNGAEALDLFTKGRFDLVMTDFEMPIMKGNELAVRIKKLVPKQPILMITAYRKELGDSQNPVDAILNKPFTLDDLRRAIANLLSN